MTTLLIFLITGLIIHEPISEADCRDLIGVARFVDATGQYLFRDGIPIAALKCDGKAVVLMLPPATGDCEVSS